MTTANHALWGATFGRLIGMPIEGAVVGSLPDLLSIPILGKYYFQGKKKANQVPKWAFNWYSFLHNWLVAGTIIILLFLINNHMWVLGAAYAWHVIEDGVFHTDYATNFLFPLWKGNIQVYSAHEHKWVQVVDLIVLIVVNILISKFQIIF